MGQNSMDRRGAVALPDLPEGHFWYFRLDPSTGYPEVQIRRRHDLLPWNAVVHTRLSIHEDGDIIERVVNLAETMADDLRWQLDDDRQWTEVLDSRRDPQRDPVQSFPELPPGFVWRWYRDSAFHCPVVQIRKKVYFGLSAFVTDAWSIRNEGSVRERLELAALRAAADFNLGRGACPQLSVPDAVDEGPIAA